VITWMKATLAVLATAALVVASTTGVLAQGTSRSVCGLDVEWLKTSAQGDIFEIRGGRMALAHSRSASVRHLASTLIVDHTKSLADARMLAAEYGIKLSNTPTPSQQWELEELSEAASSTARFNHDYSELEVKDHQQDIEETSAEVRMGCNAAIRHDAQKELPELEKHLDLAQYAASRNRFE
jgi:putative membrane protein